MIHVEKDYAAIPKGLASDAAEERRAAALRERGDHDFSSSCYGHKTVREALATLYHGKCAYCEAPLEPASPGRVEHYRPKGRVASEAERPGYYWLGYEWSNLLWSCERCNGKKLDQFPVEGIRVATPPPERGDWVANSAALLAELPLLLNPELDRPEDHLRFLSDGRIEATEGSRRGEETIRICSLDRIPLSLARKAKIDKVATDLHRQLELVSEQREAGKIADGDLLVLEQHLKLAFLTLFEGLERSGNAIEPYSRVGWHMFHEFEVFFLDRFSGETRRLLAVAWQFYLRRWRSR